MTVTRIVTGVLLRLPLGLILLFMTAALLRAGFLLPLEFHRDSAAFPFLIGLAGGLVIFALLGKFRLVYVFGHELTHWLVAKLFRRRTGRFRVGREGGSVEIENPNLWITLSPYFIPLYTLIWSGLFFLLRQLQPTLIQEYAHYGIGIMGGAYAYHLWMTAFALTREQNDLRAYGWFFSLSLILCANLFLLFLGGLAVTGEWQFGFASLWRILQEQAVWLWAWTTRTIHQIYMI